MYDKKFGTVSEFYISQIEVDYIGIISENRLVAFFAVLSFGGNRIRADIFARNRREKTAHYCHKPDSARIDDAGLFQDRQKFWCFRKRFVTDSDKRG